jgi:hypothetical protein
MLLFHGTKEENIKSILDHGLVTPTMSDWSSCWWSSELDLPPSVFLSNRPKSGIGSSPVEFAVVGDGDGYIVVVDIPDSELKRRIRGIWSTHDIDMYYDLRWKIDDFYFQYLGYDDGYSKSDSRPVLIWLKQRHPNIAERLYLQDGWLRPNPRWLLDRKRSTLCNDCQLLTSEIPNSFICTAIRVFDGKTKRILPEFDPKFESKLKHKQKSFVSLFWHHLSKK